MTRLLATPEALLETDICLAPLSKNVRGGIDPFEREHVTCERQRCESLRTAHVLKLEVEPAECDSDLASALDGVLYVRDLAHVFADADPRARGIHSGKFRWQASTLLVDGVLNGITNAGTHREPAFDGCQECHAPGYLEGHLTGTIRRSRNPGLAGATIAASYRLLTELGDVGPEGDVRGVIEGAIVTPCESSQCTSFDNMRPGVRPNPWTIGGNTYYARDHAGAPWPNPGIKTYGAVTGLDCGYELVIQLGQATDSVELVLAHFSTAATVEAFSGAASVDTDAMNAAQGVPDTLRLSGTNIDRVVVTASQDETLLVSLCTD